MPTFEAEEMNWFERLQNHLDRQVLYRFAVERPGVFRMLMNRKTAEIFMEWLETRNVWGR